LRQEQSWTIAGTAPASLRAFPGPAGADHSCALTSSSWRIVIGRERQTRGIPAGEGRLHADATGEVELDGRTLVLKRIFVQYRLQAGPGADRPAIDRVMAFHADHCAVARSLRGAIDITTSIEVISA